MTNREMLEIAMQQSAEDIGCRTEDFKTDKNVLVPLKMGKNARKYLKEPITCSLVSYGNNLVAASIPETRTSCPGISENLSSTTVLKRRTCIGWTNACLRKAIRSVSWRSTTCRI